MDSPLPPRPGRVVRRAGGGKGGGHAIAQRRHVGALAAAGTTWTILGRGVTGALRQRVVRIVGHVSEPMFEETPAQALQVTRRDERGCVVLDVVGEVDLCTAHVLRDAVSATLHRSGGRTVVVDLREVSFLGSSGLATLVQVTDEASALSEPLRLVVDENRPVVRPIEITGLDAVLALYHSLDDALAPG